MLDSAAAPLLAVGAAAVVAGTAAAVALQALPGRGLLLLAAVPSQPHTTKYQPCCTQLPGWQMAPGEVCWLSTTGLPDC
jgi:hypothetical protein